MIVQPFVDFDGMRAYIRAVTSPPANQEARKEWRITISNQFQSV
jgi:hypothetical protein